VYISNYWCNSVVFSPGATGNLGMAYKRADMFEMSQNSYREGLQGVRQKDLSEGPHTHTHTTSSYSDLPNTQHVLFPSYECHGSCTRVPFLIHMSAMTHWYGCHDSFIWTPWLSLSHTHKYTHLYRERHCYHDIIVQTYDLGVHSKIHLIHPYANISVHACVCVWARV